MGSEWTEEHRRIARERMARVRPWEKSTGPKTAEGQARAAGHHCKGYERPLQRARNVLERAFRSRRNRAEKVLAAMARLQAVEAKRRAYERRRAGETECPRRAVKSV